MPKHLFRTSTWKTHRNGHNWCFLSSFTETVALHSRNTQEQKSTHLHVISMWNRHLWAADEDPSVKGRTPPPSQHNQTDFIQREFGQFICIWYANDGPRSCRGIRRTHMARRVLAHENKPPVDSWNPVKPNRKPMKLTTMSLQFRLNFGVQNGVKNTLPPPYSWHLENCYWLYHNLNFLWSLIIKE